MFLQEISAIPVLLLLFHPAACHVIHPANVECRVGRAHACWERISQAQTRRQHRHCHSTKYRDHWSGGVRLSLNKVSAICAPLPTYADLSVGLRDWCRRAPMMRLRGQWAWKAHRSAILAKWVVAMAMIRDSLVLFLLHSMHEHLLCFSPTFPLIPTPSTGPARSLCVLLLSLTSGYWSEAGIQGGRKHAAVHFSNGHDSATLATSSVCILDASIR